MTKKRLQTPDIHSPESSPPSEIHSAMCVWLYVTVCMRKTRTTPLCCLFNEYKFYQRPPSPEQNPTWSQNLRHGTWKRTERSLQKTWRHHHCLSQLLPTLLPSLAACAHSDCCAPIPPPISKPQSLWHHSAVKFPVIQSVHVAEPYWDWGWKKDRQKETERES